MIMSDEFNDDQKIFELYEEELNAVAGGKDISISNSYSPEDVKLVGEISLDSAIKSVNKITAALHLITINI
jgi:hypothetical protein